MKNNKPPNFTDGGSKMTEEINESIQQIKFQICYKFDESNTVMHLNTSFTS